VGICGAKYLWHALSDNGHHELAWQLATQTAQPSYGWWLSQGATTLWEDWGGGASRDHVMFGDLSAWFYQHLAGIRPDPEQPGWRHILLAPQPVPALAWVKAHTDTVRGRIVSDWKAKDGRLELTVTIPANTTATVSIPTADPASVLESRWPAIKAEGVKDFRVEEGRTLFEVGSGTYHFASPL